MRYRILAARPHQPAQSFLVEASDPATASDQVTRQGFHVIATDAHGRALAISFAPGAQGIFPTSLFAVELLALLKAGLNVVEAINALTTKEAPGVYRRGLDKIGVELNRGSTFADALGTLGSALPPLFITTIRAADGSGAMHQALSRYVDYDQALGRARSKVVSAAVYPAVLIIVGGLVMLFLMLYVVPRFARIYDDMHQTLPFFSSLLFMIGRWIGDNTALLVGSSIAFGGGLALLSAQQRWRAAAWGRIEGLPAVGRWVRLFHLARLYRSLALLLQSGIPLVQAIDAARVTLPANLESPARMAAVQISEGRGVSVSLAEAGLTTPIAAQLLAVGERTGELGVMMGRLADFQDEELARVLDRAMRLMEPLLMTVIGVMVGAILVLMYMPIFELAGSLQ